MCVQCSSSELLLSTHLPTSEGWTAELTVGLWQNGSDGGARTKDSGVLSATQGLSKASNLIARGATGE